jgi:hypothetical protein
VEKSIKNAALRSLRSSINSLQTLPSKISGLPAWNPKFTRLISMTSQQGILRKNEVLRG